MIFNQVAPQVKSGLVTDTTGLTVVSGESIKVYGIVIGKDDTDATTNDITIKSGDGTITYFVIRATQQRTFILGIPFKADKGLSFTGSSSSAKRVTVFFQGPGI